jgi:hypothetical protein
MVEQLPHNFLVWKTMEISMCYGEWIKLPKLTLTPGTRRLSRLCLYEGTYILVIMTSQSLVVEAFSELSKRFSGF